MRKTFYFVAHSGEKYYIYESSYPEELGTYATSMSEVQRTDYFFAAFTRLIDASRYVEALNRREAKL